MNVKIIKRSIVIKNILIFLIFTIGYLQVCQSLAAGVSALNIQSFLTMIETHPLIWTSFTLAFLSTFFSTRFASFFLNLFFIIILKESIQLALINYNKLIIVLIFLYIISSVSFLILWIREHKSAIYNPCYSKYSIGHIDNHNIILEIESPYKKINGVLTNWDSDGCFILVKHSDSKLSGQVSLKLNLVAKSLDPMAISLQDMQMDLESKLPIFLDT